MTQGTRPDGVIFASDANEGELESFPAESRGWSVTIDGKDAVDVTDDVFSDYAGVPPKGKQRIARNFNRELAARGWYFSEAGANEWIEMHPESFVDKTPDMSENRYWILRNMGMIN